MTKSIFQMDPTPNFGVFSDFIHPFLTEVDFRSSDFHILDSGALQFGHPAVRATRQASKKCNAIDTTD